MQDDEFASLKTEQDELQRRLVRLESFVGTSKYDDLEKEERYHILVQLHFMRGYNTVLLHRISHECRTRATDK